MSTELTLRLWAELPPQALLGRLTDAVSRWQAIDGAWQGLRHVDAHLRLVWAQTEALATATMQTLALRTIAPGLCAQTGITFQCRQGDSTGHARLGLNVWGQGWRAGGDRRIEGDANLWIQTVTPYLPRPLGSNTDIEENNEALLQLLCLLIDEVAPVSMTLATGAGLPIPLNVHAVWHRERRHFLGDIALVRDLAARGLPAYALPPLSAATTPGDAAALHEWRAPEARRDLWTRLKTALTSGTEPTEADLDRVLSSGKYDVLERRGGLLLLGYPFLLTAFAAPFLLDVWSGSTS